MNLKASVGDEVIWHSLTGPTKAEFRGRTQGMIGWEVTIIVRPEGEPPYQISVPSDQIEVK